MATDRRFTGQREETAIGLYDYKARYYDPVIGRFIQADTIVPEPGNPQALNRYAYVYGNPLGYTDPSGHGACSGDDYDIGCSEDFPEQYEFTDEQWQALEYWAAQFDIPIEFVAAVVAAEIVYDTDWYDAPMDSIIGTVAYIGTQPWHRVGMYGPLAETALEASQTGIPLIGLSFGPGIGQVHAETAIKAETHFGRAFPSKPTTASERHRQLVSDFHNIKYVGAIFRMYADQRPSSRTESGQMTVDEMGAVFANYHEDVRTAFGGEGEYAAGYPPTSSGKRWRDQLRPFVWYYRVWLGK